MGRCAFAEVRGGKSRKGAAGSSGTAPSCATVYKASDLDALILESSVLANPEDANVTVVVDYSEPLPKDVYRYRGTTIRAASPMQRLYALCVSLPCSRQFIDFPFLFHSSPVVQSTIAWVGEDIACAAFSKDWKSRYTALFMRRLSDSASRSWRN